MHTLARGILVAIEGIDGSGKSTLAHDFFSALTQKKFPILLTKEPGDSKLGKQLREMLQKQDIPLCAKAEYLLFAADRAQHFDEVIIPALQEKKIIISDRLADSSVVYQGYGRGLDKVMIRSINAWAMNSREPDLVFYMNISPEIARERLRKRNEKLSAFEQEQASFTQKLIHGFNEIFKNRKNVISLDGTQSPENVAQQATNALLTWIQTKNLLT